jgi:hypothetical protein
MRKNNRKIKTKQRKESKRKRTNRVIWNRIRDRDKYFFVCKFQINRCIIAGTSPKKKGERESKQDREGKRREEKERSEQRNEPLGQLA